MRPVITEKDRRISARSLDALSAISSSERIQRLISLESCVSGSRRINRSARQSWGSSTGVPVSVPYSEHAPTQSKSLATESSSPMERARPMPASFNSWRTSKFAPKDRRSLFNIRLSAAAVCSWASSIHPIFCDGRRVSHMRFAGVLPVKPDRISVILSNSKVCKTFAFIMIKIYPNR